MLKVCVEMAYLESTDLEEFDLPKHTTKKTKNRLSREIYEMNQINKKRFMKLKDFYDVFTEIVKSVGHD